MIPLTWNNGSTNRQRSAELIPNQSTIMLLVEATFEWSRMTPFGRPVVPLV